MEREIHAAESSYPREHKDLRQRLEEFYGEDIKVILRDHAGEYAPSEFDWGQPEGDEEW